MSLKTYPVNAMDSGFVIFLVIMLKIPLYTILFDQNEKMNKLLTLIKKHTGLPVIEILT